MATLYRFKEFWTCQGIEYKRITILHATGRVHAVYKTHRVLDPSDSQYGLWAPLITDYAPAAELLGTWHSDDSTRNLASLPHMLALAFAHEQNRARASKSEPIGFDYRLQIARMEASDQARLALRPIHVRFDASDITALQRRNRLREIMQASPELILDWLLMPETRPDETIIDQPTQGEDR